MGKLIEFPFNNESINDNVSIDDNVEVINTDMICSNLGRNIRFLRESEGLSLNKLAKELEMSKGYLWEIEKGKKNPSIDVVLRIAKYFGETFDELLYNDIANEMYLRHMLEDGEIEYDENIFRMIAKILKPKFFAVNVYNEPGLNGVDFYLCVSNGRVIYEVDCEGNILIVDGTSKSQIMSHVPMNNILEFFRHLYNNGGSNYMKPVLN